MTISTNSSPKHFGYIDALRGYAILMVILVHVQGSFQDLPEWSKNILVQGARGVQLFFVLSAFTLMLSWHSRGNHPIAFYIRRLFRIAPLFWLGMVFYTLLYGMGPTHDAPYGMDWKFLLATFFFMHGWFPQMINSVVPGGWSIAVEMNFYLIFPLLMRYIRKTWHAVVLTALAIIGARIGYIVTYQLFDAFTTNLPPYLIGSFAMLWFFNQIPSFLMGISVYYLVKKYPNFPKKYSQTILIAAIAWMLGMCLCKVTHAYSLYLFSIAFGLVLFAMASHAGKYLVNPVITFIGRVSYSAYICHFALMDVFSRERAETILPILHDHPGFSFCLTWLVTVAIVMFVSWLLNMAIEKPMIKVGHRLAAHYN